MFKKPNFGIFQYNTPRYFAIVVKNTHYLACLDKKSLKNIWPEKHRKKTPALRSSSKRCRPSSNTTSSTTSTARAARRALHNSSAGCAAGSASCSTRSGRTVRASSSSGSRPRWLRWRRAVSKSSDSTRPTASRRRDTTSWWRTWRRAWRS